MADRCPLLVQVFRQPNRVTTFKLADWDLLLRQAQGADVVPRLWPLLDAEGMLDAVPEQVMVHLESGRILAEGHKRFVTWEVNRICHAFKDRDIPVILLKGAAYMLADMPFAAGRVFSDIDLLVARDKLERAEKALFFHGWLTTHLDEYDQRYYRQWMHELPPLRHFKRKSVLDVHHTILPLTATLKPDSAKLFAAIVPLDDNPQVFTLAPIDMVLHSATHLFHEGEFEHGFRGLTDLDGLLRYFSRRIDGFWPELIQRAGELDLKMPLYYALRYTEAILNSPVPRDAIEKIGDAVPRGLRTKFMDLLFYRALQPYHHSCETFGSSSARWLLFVRSHYLRMPFHLLIPHLIKKASKPRKEV